MRKVLGLLLAAAVAVSAAAYSYEPTPVTPTVAVAGDSVILTVTIDEDVGAQPVSVDSFVVKSGHTTFGNDYPIRAARAASGPTAVRFAWPKTVWAPNTTVGGTIKVTMGHIAPGECGAGVCWGPETATASWSYFRDATAPGAIRGDAVTWSAGLN